jgi:hypothetical protein
MSDLSLQSTAKQTKIRSLINTALGAGEGLVGSADPDRPKNSD